MKKQRQIVVSVLTALLLLVANISLFGCGNSNGLSGSNETSDTLQGDSSSSGGDENQGTDESFVEGDAIMKDPYEDFN